MYRNNENPLSLQERLDSVTEKYHELLRTGRLDVYQQMDYEMEIADLKDRINYAWQDDYAE